MSITVPDYEFVCRLVRETSAIVLEPGKEYLVEARLAPIARQLKLASLAELIGQLRTRPGGELRTRIIEAMVTTETSFFRDIHPYESLRTGVVPDLIAKRAAERVLNIWSAACSTGQEPYTVAMLLREHFPELRGWTINLLATDLSGENVVKARAGRFNQVEVNRGLPAGLLVKHFTQHGTTWELGPDIRGMVEFREMNLARPWPVLPRMDLILLRNVMIYFDVETKKEILRRAAERLRPGGYLLLGGAETPFNLCPAFSRVERFRGGFYQLAD